MQSQAAFKAESFENGISVFLSKTRSPSDVEELEVSVQPEVIPFPAPETWGEAHAASCPALVHMLLSLGWMVCGFTSPFPPVYI